MATRKERPVLEHPVLQPFEPQLKALLEFAFDGGIRSLETAGYKLGDDLVDDDACEHFRNGLFSAFGQTQSMVGMSFIELETKRRELLKNLKRLRSERNPAQQHIQEQLEAVENRQLVLRRLMDGILWVLMPKVWIANHLAVQKDVRQPDPEELERLLSIALKQNQEDKRAIHLVSDLTAIVQIGDIIRIRWDEDGVYLRLQEIKVGQMNDTLGDLIDSAGGVLSDMALKEIETKFGHHAKTQASRMIRQRERFQQFGSIIQNGSRASDARKDDLMETLTKKKPPSVRSYLPKLPELVADAKTQGMGIHGIDGCLWLVGLSEKGLAELGEVKKLPHLLFHLKNPELKCQIQEVDALHREAPLVNLAVHNMTYVMSRSPLIWYPKDLVLDVVMDRIRIYAQFDLNAFFKLAGKAGLELTLITGKEAEEGKRTKASSPMLEDPKAYGVKVKFSNGRVLRLRSSLFRSVYSHLVPPSEILRVIATLDEVQRSCLGT